MSDARGRLVDMGRSRSQLSRTAWMSRSAPAMSIGVTSHDERMPHLAVPSYAPGGRERLVLALGAFALTTFFALLYALRGGIAAQERGDTVEWGRQVLDSVVIWWACLPLLPPLAWLVRVAPVARQNWMRNLAIIFAGTLFAALARQHLVSPALDWVTGRPLFPGSGVARTLTYFSTFLVVVGLLHAAHFYQGLRAREVEAARLAQSLAEARLTTLRAQLQPHFLFNTLNAATALIHHDPLTADRMLTRLAALLRSALRTPAAETHTLREELEVLDQYLDLMTLRFGDRLHVRRSIDPDALDVRVPWLVLQPLVENALEHGLAGVRAGGTISLGAERRPRELRLIIEDDGVGLDRRAMEQRESGDEGGIGLANTRRRLEQLYRGDARLELTPREEGGTRVTVTIPLVGAEARAELTHA